jgi:prepilin-type N-terminal cleavage/methylation domain-containing protein
MDARGFGLIEFMVTIAIMALLASYAIPSMRSSLSTSQARLVTQRFIQDFSWMRSQAVTGTHTISLTVNSDCSWSSTQDGSTIASRSYTSAQLTSTASGISCALGSGSLPVTFTLDNQGFSSTAVALTFTATSGQAFPLQVLNSGAVIRLSGAS